MFGPSLCQWLNPLFANVGFHTSCIACVWWKANSSCTQHVFHNKGSSIGAQLVQCGQSPVWMAQGLHCMLLRHHRAKQGLSSPVQCSSMVWQRHKQRSLELDHANSICSPPYSPLSPCFFFHHLFHCEEWVNVKLKARRTRSFGSISEHFRD